MTTTGLPTGLSNAALDSALSSYIAFDPATAHAWFDDFDSFIPAEWTVTETQAGATQGIANGDGGWLALVNSAANNDLNAIQLANETFVISAAKRFWMKTRFKLDSALNAAAVIGLQITDATPLAVSDGVFFSKAAASTTLNLVVEKASTATTIAVGTMADDTFVTAGCFYSPDDGVMYKFFNDQPIGAVSVVNLPTRTLCVSIAVANGTAAARTLTCDYLFAATER